MILPQRKNTRIPGYNYASQNYYFITICTHERKCIFGEPNDLNAFGRVAEAYLLRIPEFYPQVIVDQCVVMPNHVHAILIFETEERETELPDLTRVVGQYKMAVTKKIREKSPNCMIWQRSFHDHIIRNEQSYEKIWEYIRDNPMKWEEDCFYYSKNGT